MAGVVLVALFAAARDIAADERNIVVTPRSSSIEHPYVSSWAVVVGVDRFRDRRVSRLNYAANDAVSVAKALGVLGFPSDKIFLLVNDQATRAAIEHLLSSVVRRGAGLDDRVFVFFAMHGVTATLPHGGEEGYLLPYDADIDDLPLTALSMQELKQIGQRIAAKHILIAVDACYGGYSLVRAQAPASVDQRYLELILKSRTIQVLTAGRRDQPVIEDQGHGVFTRSLLRGLEGHADSNGDGLITAAELAAWMHPRVAQASDYKQDMQWGSLDGEGQFVFVLPRQQSLAVREATPSPSPSEPSPISTPSTSPPVGTPSTTPPMPRVGEGQIATLPPDAALRPFAGKWEGWMSTSLSEALVGLSLVQEGATVQATLVLSSARNRGSGTIGFQEAYPLLKRASAPILLSRVSVTGRRLSAQDADRAVVLELDLSKGTPILQGTIRVEGTSYYVSLRRK